MYAIASPSRLNNWPVALAILLATLTTPAPNLSAQTHTGDSNSGTILGRVVDADTGFGLAGAYITIDGTRLGAAADTSAPSPSRMSLQASTDSSSR
jgi:hypothetical protein